MKFQFVCLKYERTALKTASVTGRKELCAANYYSYYYYFYYYCNYYYYSSR